MSYPRLAWTVLRLLPCALIGLAGCSTGVEGSVGSPTDPVLSGGNSSLDDDDSGAELCGDGSIDPGEECDQGEENSDDSICTPNCMLAFCGDGFTLPGAEACDNGEANADNAECLLNCSLATCGDGLVQTDVEECDDGDANTDEGDGCTLDCHINTCGDSKVDEGEACDDGNDDETDGCLPSCVLASCGDSIIQGGVEECDAGEDNADDASCLSSCTLASCGDSYTQQDIEECDLGLDNGDGSACLSSCMLATCGDGFLQTDVEECDDGNNTSGDGCTLDCILELECGNTFNTDWCLQSGTKEQYTRCESVTNGGKTCKNPEIRYGLLSGGVPRKHPSGSTYYPLWCEQLGFAGFSSIGFGARSCDAPQGSVYPCISYDENDVWHWCDWDDGFWYNQTLNKHNCDGTEIISVTCTI